MNKKCTSQSKLELTCVLELAQSSLVYFLFSYVVPLASLLLISASSISPLLRFIYTALKHDGCICKFTFCSALHCSTENMLFDAVYEFQSIIVLYIIDTFLVKLMGHFWWRQYWGGLRCHCVPCRIWENSASIFSASDL